MKLLFVGNSHTYYNSMPDTVRRLLVATGQKVHITMLTEGGKNLAFHASSPNTIFNIRCGEYDMLIAQDRASGFDAATFQNSARALLDAATKAGTKFFLFMPWTGRDNRGAQRAMTEVYHRFCRTGNCMFAPVGEVFSRLLVTEAPDLFYREDGNHTTPLGSYVAAVTIFYTITGRKRVLDPEDIKDPGIAAGFPAELCRKIHTEACHTTRLYNG